MNERIVLKKWDYMFYKDYTEYIIDKKIQYSDKRYIPKNKMPTGKNLLNSFLVNKYGLLDKEIIIKIFDRIKDLIHDLTIKSVYVLFSYMEDNCDEMDIYDFSVFKKNFDFKEAEKTYNKYSNYDEKNKIINLIDFL